ncbi:uncharacterized protein LOC110069225 [Orbicella faveolata]|uniref:uncharacterized protein LOC110069225 n=1 Tax=Orbicella faveolata TaxID=48498 RepID=UPI0009E22C70|nr:uncharacterized protein LOC110069225 [Orbicella faveolata]
MLLKWAVILSVFVAASFGSVLPGKRSDFSMYDNQFSRVGDTELDDEITDCALVEHQYRKGYIRLREYLERKRGCGRRGNLNLDVLKNKILHTTNATFLRRMLALIQKITHHKDFHKLQAPARSFVAQANTAVQALNNAYNERVSSSPVTMGIDYPLSKKSAVQRFNQAYNINQRISASPINLGTVNQLYGNNYKKSTVQAMNNQAYNDRISATSPLNMATGNPVYGNNYSVSKKFQIARNPYYQNYYQYRQPYYSNLQSMQYGLYNGNQP